jgi:cytochrome oxidase Cu insertion factor (SCO1/SenC/PrrC family)
VSEIESNQNTRPAKRSYKVLWIMILLFSLPYVAALYIYTHRDELSIGTQSNYGQIIHPAKKISDDVFLQLDGSDFHFSDNEIRGKWLLVTVSSARCDKPCMDNMYKLRQLRKAAGENSLRLQRIFILSDEVNIDSLAGRLDEYSCMHTQFNDTECLKILKYMGSTSDNLFNLLKVNSHAVNDGIYMVDPMGQYMMFYPPDADPKKMLKDIERLLEVSKIG